MTALQDTINEAKAVSGVTLITPDNTTTLTDYVNNYSLASMNSNHWVGSTSIGANSSVAVVDENTKVFGTNNLVCPCLSTV
jgi:cellobiose dehydrogenase (acceptor)